MDTEATVTALGTFLDDCGTVLNAFVGWMGQIGEAVMSTPILLVPAVASIALIGVGLFHRLKG